jgi:hypothetical protein
MNMGLAKMLMFSVLMRRVRMSDRRMVVLMNVSSGQVLPFTEDLVKALTAIMGYVIVIVIVSQSLVAVFNEREDMGPLSRFLGEASGRKRPPQNRRDCHNSPADQRDPRKDSFHNLLLALGPPFTEE